MYMMVLFYENTALLCLAFFNCYNFFSDIVFFIFLYQRWIYKVDHKRVNEFGFSGEMEDQQKNGQTPAIEEKEQPDKKND